jgi:probable phosphoglycerate mutase
VPPSPWLGIRHAQSVWNAQARVQGQADPPLSDEGRAQAGALAPRLASLGLAALVTSDLRRARETAEILAPRLGLPVELEPGLRERDLGAWSGLTHPEIARRWPDDYARWRAGDPALRPGGGESRRALRRRVGAALARLRARHPGGCLALVTHMGVLRALVPDARLDNTGTLWIPPEAHEAPPPPAEERVPEPEAV